MSSKRENIQDGKSAPENMDPGAGGRLIQFVSRNRPIAWLVALTTGLVVFIAILPRYVWILFWQGLQTHKTLTSLVLIFSLLAISLVWSTGQRVDAWFFLYFNVWGPRPLWLDRVMLGFTQIGNGITALAIALALFLAGERLLAYELVLGTLTLWLVVELLKALVRRSRPFIRLTQTRIVGYQARGRSFPSGHTSQAFFMATLTAQHFHAGIWAVLLLYALALLVGITRMYAGAHYPRDVLAGAILGSAWGLLGGIVDPYVLK
jgi:membrane-associated phospholipid phosphatase